MIKSAYRTCQIIKLIAENSDGQRHSEIRKILNIPTSSLSGLLSTLINQQFVNFDIESHKYFLGPELLSLLSKYIHSIDIVDETREIMHKLRVETGESTALAIRVGNDILIVDKEDSPKPIMPTLPIGDRIPLYATALGKVFLACISEQELEQYLSSIDLSPLSKNTITDVKTLRDEVKKVRSSGIAVSRGEFHEEIFAVAAPIFDFNGKIKVALSITLPLTRLSAEKKKMFIDSLKDAINTLSQRFGYNVQG